MLLLAISGAYLYLLPYLAKRKRNKRKKSIVEEKQGKKS
jgi:hypothetical protein